MPGMQGQTVISFSFHPERIIVFRNGIDRGRQFVYVAHIEFVFISLCG